MSTATPCLRALCATVILVIVASLTTVPTIASPQDVPRAGYGCGSAPEPTPPAETPRPDRAATPAPSVTPSPAASAEPSEAAAPPSAAPTASSPTGGSPEASAGPTELPEPTAAPEATPEPEATDTPTVRPDPTPTPDPTAAPTERPERTPKPTPEPERTPKPTPEPEPTPRPEPTTAPAAEEPAPSTQAIAMLAARRVSVSPDVREAIARVVAWLRSLIPGVLGVDPVPIEAPPRAIPRARDDRLGQVRGIDISHWNGLVDQVAAANGGIRFVIAKATQGTYLTDPRFRENVAAARGAGVVVGAYHFYDYREPGRAQARHLLDVLAAADMLDDALPPVVDIECFEPFGTADQAFVREELRAFSDTVFAATGRLPMIYTSGHMWDEVLGDDPGFGDHPLWVACWRCPEPDLPAGWGDWLLWQIGSMAVEGRSSRLDGNIARDAATLRSASTTDSLVRGPSITQRRTVTIVRAGGGASTRVRIAGERWSAWSRPGVRVRTTLPDRDDRYTVEVQRRAGSGVLGPVEKATVELDRHGPAIGVDLDRGTGRVRVTADDRGGVRRFEVGASCRADDTGRTVVVQPTSGGSSLDITIPARSTCRLRIGAADRAGNRTRMVSGPLRRSEVLRAGPRAW